MRTPFRFMTVLALVLSLLAVGASAQSSTTGSLEGTVVDVNGAAVPGVAVTATRQGGRTQTATTNEEGVYRIPNLEPGRYTVTIEATKGFGRFEQAEVEVSLSRTSNVTITLRPAGATEVVEVTASSGAAIDVTGTTSGTNVSTEQFSNFPTQRTIQSLYNIAPSVTRSGLKDASGRDRDPSVAGSSGPENNYILDGITTTDPAFGGGGANMPFEFVQEVEVKTGAYGAEYGNSTGGIFNVITKSGNNDLRGDVFAYFTPKSFVRDVKASAIPFTGAVPSKFSEIDAGFDLGGPIKKDKLWFFGAFNPQRRTNQYLTQTFQTEVENRVTTPFYAGKITWQPTQRHLFNFSTFGDFTKQEGFLFQLNARVPSSGFGTSPNLFNGLIETGGQNYAARLNSTFSSNHIGEYSFGLHLQRANTTPASEVAGQSQIIDNFAILRGGAILPVVDTTVVDPNTTTTHHPVTDAEITGLPGVFIAFVDGRGGTVQRNFQRAGFGLVSDQDRNRWELAARQQSIYKNHTLKYGFEFMENRYKILTTSSGPARTFADPYLQEILDSNGNPVDPNHRATDMPGGVRITNNFGICAAVGAVAQCPTATFERRLDALIAAGQGPAGITSAETVSGLTSAQLQANPILVFSSARVRDFFLNTGDSATKTRVESFYFQDDWKVTRNFQLNLGVRWDYQQAYGTDSPYIKLNNFISNMSPRFGAVWDFTGRGRGKVYANFAKFIESPIPLDVNVRAGGDEIQLDRNINANRVNAPTSSVIFQGSLAGLGCLGCHSTPVDTDLKPQSVWEGRAGIEYEAIRDLTLGFSGVYRSMGWVIEDGSFDDGTTYFLFNPGRRGRGPNDVTTEDLACNDPNIGCFGRARRYYRGLEFTATKRFTNDFQFISSYTYSSLIGNYEGLFRNDNGQSDPNITSLFDLPSLLNNLYGRLPNDRPHQFKFNGSYRTPIRLMLSGNYYIQSGQPFNEFIPHPVYGNNEGLGQPRGTAINPVTGRNRTPTTSQLDLGAYYPIPLGENRELRFQADWFNVANSQRALREDETFTINSGIPGAQGIQFPNPFYGTGLVFQFPSTFRLGAKFSF